MTATQQAEREYKAQGIIVSMVPRDEDRSIVEIDAADLPFDGHLNLHLHKRFDAAAFAAAEAAAATGEPVEVRYVLKTLDSGKRIKQTTYLGPPRSNGDSGQPGVPSTVSDAFPNAQVVDERGQRILRQTCMKCAAALLGSAIQSGSVPLTAETQSDLVAGLADVNTALTDALYDRFTG